MSEHDPWSDPCPHGMARKHDCRVCYPRTETDADAVPDGVMVLERECTRLRAALAAVTRQRDDAASAYGDACESGTALQYRLATAEGECDAALVREGALSRVVQLVASGAVYSEMHPDGSEDGEEHTVWIWTGIETDDVVSDSLAGIFRAAVAADRAWLEGMAEAVEGARGGAGG